MNPEPSYHAKHIPPKKLKKLYKRHVRGAIVRSTASLCMWTFALAGYEAGFLKSNHFIGISISVVYLILINLPTLYVLKYITGRLFYKIFSLFINQLEIVGYTAIIYFCGGIEAGYLTLLYAALIVYVGVAAQRINSFIVAGLCITTYSLMVVLSLAGVLPHVSIIPDQKINPPFQLFILVVIVGLLFVLAFISATTADLLRKSRNKLYEQNLKLAVAIKKLRQEFEDRKRSESEKQELQKKLQRAQKMEAIGTLAGGVAHDINNVLSGIVSYPDLLLLQIPEEDPMRDSLLTIKKSGEKVAAIVQDLLTLTRRGVVASELVNFNDIIASYQESPEYEKMLLYHPQVNVATELEKDLLNIEGSTIHLSKTIMNLVSNAAEAMPEGGTILIRTENRHYDKPTRHFDHVAEGDYIVVTVSDSGIGIPEDDLEKIFEPFYTKKKMGRSGTGLGMAVVWGTVKDCQGFIDVQSTEGKGTTFTLHFPATRKQPVQTRAPLSLEDYKGRGESILVVDDVEEQRQIAAKILVELGYTVNTVSSGEQAIEHVRQKSEDLLILDMIMAPGMDGLDTCKQILQIYPEQKIIIASGFSETQRVKEAQKLGVGAYLQKPFTIENLALAVKAQLSKKVL
ncbi:MAG: ATP-binding protein [Desulfobacterales bacterium]